MMMMTILPLPAALHQLGDFSNVANFFPIFKRGKMSKSNPVHPWRFGRTRALIFTQKWLKRAKIGMVHATPKIFLRPNKSVSRVFKTQLSKINWKIKSIFSGLATRTDQYAPNSIQFDRYRYLQFKIPNLFPGKFTYCSIFWFEFNLIFKEIRFFVCRKIDI